MARPDGIGKPLQPQWDIKSDIVRQGEQPIDTNPNANEAIKRSEKPRDQSGNETFGWPGIL